MFVSRLRIWILRITLRAIGLPFFSTHRASIGRVDFAWRKSALGQKPKLLAAATHFCFAAKSGFRSVFLFFVSLSKPR